jgi:ketosteroid isomerase-like protein
MYRPLGNSIPSVGQNVESTIRESIQDFCMNFNTGNYDQCSSLFSPEGYLLSPNQEMVQGTKAIERTLENFTDRGYSDLRMETIRVDASGDMAAEIGRYTQSIRLGNGTTVVDRGKYLNVWRRLGAWRIMTACWSSNLPALLDQSASDTTRASKDVEKMSPNVTKSA